MLDSVRLRAALAGDERWSGLIDAFETNSVGLHLAVFIEPYLRYVLEGRKTVESRFGVHRVPPFGCVEPEDVVLLKSASGPIVGIAQVANVWFYRLGVGAWNEIRERFGPALCLDDEDAFIATRSRSRFATLIRLTNVRELAPVPVAKRDRRGWVVLRNAHEAPVLPGLEGFV